MLMSVPLTMEGVTTTVQTPLVAMSAVATLVTHWMGMDTLAKVNSEQLSIRREHLTFIAIRTFDSFSSQCF